MIGALWKNDIRHYLILLNIIAFAALIIYLIVSVLSPKRAELQTRTPANQTPFLADDELEGRRLERVQGWALLFAAVIAIALPIYWLREPTRQSQSKSYFDNNSIHRGAVLFARPGTPDYFAATSKQCANCHGDKGQGGTASFRINGIQVAWKAPPLNTELLRFTEDPKCADPSLKDATTECEITDIITYGRPGTPMQGWGVAGGGPLNDQSIADLVAFIESIQLTPKQSQANAAAALAAAKDPNTKTCPEYVSCPALAVSTARDTLKTDQNALHDAIAKVQKTLSLPGASTTDLDTKCADIATQVKKIGLGVTDPLKTEGIDCEAYTTATKTVSADRDALNWALEWQKRRANVSDGQILFEYACARCHTEGWSVFDPTKAPGADHPDAITILGLSGGGGGTGGGIGFNLRDGDTIRRFGADRDGGWQTQVDFVSTGTDANKPYGNLGLGTGKMPGFGSMLTQQQIQEIVTYERYCLEATDYKSVSPVCQTDPPGPREIPTTTTTAASANG